MTTDDDKPLTPQQARQKLQKGLGDYLAGNDPGPIVFPSSGPRRPARRIRSSSPSNSGRHCSNAPD